MSEYQWVEFRAIDAPLDDEQVKFMHTQSSRAEISPWSFTNEYSFGDFRGDAIEMMRRGYDLHIHYANFGIRRIYLRFPNGFAFADELEAHLLDEQITWLADVQGSGGILMIDTAIDEKNRPGYQRAADELALLAKACGSPVAQAKGETIRKEYPARTALSSILKEAGF